MVWTWCVAWGVAAGVFAGAGPAWAGWAIEQIELGTGEATDKHVFLQANRIKILPFGRDRRPKVATIVDLDADIVTEVDYSGRRYAAATVQEYVQFMRDTMQMTAQALQQIPEIFKMPPEGRQQFEGLMQQMQSSFLGVTQACGTSRAEVRLTGQQEQIAGFPAVRYDVLSDSRPSVEIWVAATLTAWRELDRVKLERFAHATAGAIPYCLPAMVALLFGADQAWKLAGEGFPVRIVHRNGGTTTIQVVRAKIRTLPPSEFRPPAGFARSTLRELQAR